MRMFVIFLLLTIFISSCSSNRNVKKEELGGDITFEASKQKVEDNLPEQIFSYEDKNHYSLNKDEIDLSCEPQEIKGIGFLRLAGRVEDILLIEICGVCRFFKNGEKLGDYKIFCSEDNKVRLLKEEIKK